MVLVVVEVLGLLVGVVGLMDAVLVVVVVIEVEAQRTLHVLGPTGVPE